LLISAALCLTGGVLAAATIRKRLPPSGMAAIGLVG
jgi:hypothetical protein